MSTRIAAVLLIVLLPGCASSTDREGLLPEDSASARAVVRTAAQDAHPALRGTDWLTYASCESSATGTTRDVDCSVGFGDYDDFKWCTRSYRADPEGRGVTPAQAPIRCKELPADDMLRSMDRRARDRAPAAGRPSSSREYDPLEYDGRGEYRNSP